VAVPAFKATRESIRYGFAVGKVRVLETKVFGLATYERLLDAADFSEQRRILSDTLYGRYLEGAESATDVERGMDSALDDFYRFLDEANLPSAVVRFFRERYDFANLKGALKAELLGVRSDDLLVGLGTIPVEGFSGPLDELPAPWGEVARRALEAVRADGSAGESARGREAAVSTSRRAGETSNEAPQVSEGALRSVDTEVDRAMFVELGKLARESKSTFLRDLAALQIDIANVRTLVRARLAGMTAEAALEAALQGGSIPVKKLEALYQMPLAEAGAHLADLPQLKGISVADLIDVSRLDVIADNMVVEYLRRARLVSIGAEPVIAYVMGREAEVMAVRTLLIGKLSGLSSEVLRRRMRDLYV
jgi:V/A-type H+-transporting ATPase subunit C